MNNKHYIHAALILILALNMQSCCNCPQIAVKEVIRLDTSYIPIITHDTLKLQGDAKIIYIDSTQWIHPYTALIDSLISIDKKQVKVKASYDSKSNNFKINLEQTKQDSIPKITETKQTVETKIEYVNRLDWYMYFVFAGIGYLFLGIGYLIGKK